MIKHKERRVKQLIPVSVTCDKCNTTFDIDDFDIQEFHHIEFTGGYSSIFGDGNEIDADFCQSCLHEIIKDYCRCNGFKMSKEVHPELQDDGIENTNMVLLTSLEYEGRN